MGSRGDAPARYGGEPDLPSSCRRFRRSRVIQPANRAAEAEVAIVWFRSSGPGSTLEPVSRREGRRLVSPGRDGQEARAPERGRDACPASGVPEHLGDRTIAELHDGVAQGFTGLTPLWGRAARRRHVTSYRPAPAGRGHVACFASGVREQCHDECLRTGGQTCRAVTRHPARLQSPAVVGLMVTRTTTRQEARRHDACPASGVPEQVRDNGRPRLQASKWRERPRHAAAG